MNRERSEKINLGFHERSRLMKRLRIRMIKGGGSLRYWWYRLRWNVCPRINATPAFPLHLIIELTNACNLRCIHCNRPVKNEHKALDYTTVTEYIDEAASYGLPSLLLSYGGEVLLYKDLIPVLEYAGSKKTFRELSIVTNATLLSPKITDALLQTGLTQIIFSVDGLAKDTYEHIRAGADFERTMDNIEYFLKKKKEMKKKRPLVRVQMVGMKQNRHEIEDFIAHWEPKVDMVTVNEWIQPKEFTEDFSLDDRYEQSASRQKSSRPCAQLWQRMAVNARKEIILCNGEYNIGAKGNRTLYDCWHSPEAVSIRKLHKQGRQDSIECCRECSLRYF